MSPPTALSGRPRPGLGALHPLDCEFSHSATNSVAISQNSYYALVRRLQAIQRSLVDPQSGGMMSRKITLVLGALLTFLALLFVQSAAAAAERTEINGNPTD